MILMSNESTSNFPPFPCTRCGAGCRSVAYSPLTTWLDRGDGICRHLEEKNEFCSIYDHRPDICHIETQYKLNYQKEISWNDFCELNKKCCHILKENLAINPCPSHPQHANTTALPVTGARSSSRKAMC